MDAAGRYGAVPAGGLHQPGIGRSGAMDFEKHCLQIRRCYANGRGILEEDSRISGKRSVGAQRPHRLQGGAQQRAARQRRQGRGRLHLPAREGAGAASL